MFNWKKNLHRSSAWLSVRAEEAGLCGVPSFQVNDSSEIVWGQDRLNVVADYICGLHYAKL